MEYVVVKVAGLYVNRTPRSYKGFPVLCKEWLVPMTIRNEDSSLQLVLDNEKHRLSFLNSVM